MLRELAELRAAEAYQLTQADKPPCETYFSTNRTARLAERDQLRAQLAGPTAPVAASCR